MAEFEHLLQVYARLAQEARDAALGNGGQLYRSLSVNPHVNDPLSNNASRLVMLLLLALFAGAILGLLVHLLYAALLPPTLVVTPSEKAGGATELESGERVDASRPYRAIAARE